MLPGATSERSQRESVKGRPAAAPRDPAAHRALAARRRRHRRPGRADRDHRLRRAPGGRRHALRVDHGRLDRAVAGAPAHRPGAGRASASSAAVSVGIMDGQAAARPRLLPRTRTPRSTSTWWPPTPARTSRSRARRRASPSAAPSWTELLTLADSGIAPAVRGPATGLGRGRGGPAPVTVRRSWSRPRSRAQAPGAADAARICRAGAGRRSTSRASRARRSRTPPRSGATPSSRRASTRAVRDAHARRRLGPRGRRPRRCARACSPGATPARTRPTRRTTPSCWVTCGAWLPSGARRATVCVLAFLDPTDVNGRRKGRRRYVVTRSGRFDGRIALDLAWRERLRLRPALRTCDGTDRWPNGGTAGSRGEEPRLAPRDRRPRDGALLAGARRRWCAPTPQ